MIVRASRTHQPVSALLYHHVGPRRAGTNQALTTTPQRFERQLRWLEKERWNVVSPATWLDARHDADERFVVLTFDDGYADLATYALPLLAERGFGAAVYVVSNLCGGTNIWDSPSTAHPLLDREAIAEWSKRGFEFGGHSRTHCDLRRISGTELTDEVEGCAADLEAIDGVRARTFAYPYGFHDERVRAAVMRRFEAAFTIQEGQNGPSSRLDSLRRTMVQQGDTMLDFASRVRNGTAPLYRLRVRVARWRGRIT